MGSDLGIVPDGLGCRKAERSVGHGQVAVVAWELSTSNTAVDSGIDSW